MRFNCPRVSANFPAEKLRLVNRDQTRMLWDEHGGTFVLRVEDLEVVEAPEPASTEVDISRRSNCRRPSPWPGRSRALPESTACDWPRTSRLELSETPIL